MSTPFQPSPTNLSDELKTILDKHAEYYIRETMKFFQNEGVSPALSKDNPGDLKAFAAITAAYAEAIRSAVPEKRKMDSPNGGDMCPYCYEDVEGGLTPFNDGFNRAIDTFTANLQKAGILPTNGSDGTKG